jgi:hypothetical protein
VHETTELRQSQLAAFVVETPHGAILTINV